MDFHFKKLRIFLEYWLKYVDISADVSWYREGEEITDKEERVLSLADKGTRQLIIFDVNRYKVTVKR